MSIIDPGEPPEPVTSKVHLELVARLDAVRDQVANAALAAGRDPFDVSILLATKTQPAQVVAQAIAAGFNLIGENRVQEMTAKAGELTHLPHTTHFIGALQRNKVRAAVMVADCIETVADLALAERLNALAPSRNEWKQFDANGNQDPPPLPLPFDVMVQVNTSGEATKAGCLPAQAADLAAAITQLPNLRLTGLMTIGLNSLDRRAVARSYAELRRIRDLVQRSIPSARHLSMGMSGDLDLAIAEGATIVRLGTAAFGQRFTGR